MPDANLSVLAALLTGSEPELLPGNALTPQQPPLIAWGTVRSDTETPTADGQAVTWTVSWGGETRQVPFAVISADPRVEHDDDAGTEPTLTPRTGDTVLLVIANTGEAAMLGKVEGTL